MKTGFDLLRNSALAAVLAFGMTGLTACGDDGEQAAPPAEPASMDDSGAAGAMDEAAGAAEDAMDAAGEAAEDAADAMEEGAEDAGDAMEEGAEDAGDAMEGAADSMKGE